MTIRSFFSLALVSSALFAFTTFTASDAHACACCSDPGERIENTNKMTTYEKAEIEKVVFTKKTRLYSNAGGSGNGVSDPSDVYDLTVTRAGDRWTFAFKDAKGKTGSLAFLMPDTLETFSIDQHDGKPHVDPVLYKEWRFNAPLVLTTGIFAGATTKAGAPTIRVVLQGHGNSCTWADQFSSYTLAITGPAAVRFSFFGFLTPATTPSSTTP